MCERCDEVATWPWYRRLWDYFFGGSLLGYPDPNEWHGNIE